MFGTIPSSSLCECLVKVHRTLLSFTTVHSSCRSVMNGSISSFTGRRIHRGHRLKGSCPFLALERKWRLVQVDYDNHRRFFFKSDRLHRVIRIRMHVISSALVSFLWYLQWSCQWMLLVGWLVGWLIMISLKQKKKNARFVVVRWRDRMMCQYY